MSENIDYKNLWFELGKEKKQLQIDNIRLKKDSEYWRKEAEKFQRFYNEVKKND